MANTYTQDELKKLLGGSAPSAQPANPAGSPITGGSTGMGSVIGGAIGTAAGTAFGGVGGPVGGMIGSALGSLAGAGLSAASQMRKTSYEKESEARLKDLKRRQELGTLGLTEREKQALYLQGSAGAEKTAKDIRALQGATAASLATGAGLAASQKQMEDEALLAQRTAAAQDVMNRDILEKRALEQEIEQRKALQEETKSRIAAAKLSVAQTGIGSVEEALKLAKQVRGRAPSSEEIKQFQAYTGITDPTKAAQVFQLMGAASPEQQELLSGLLVTPSSYGALTAPAINVPLLK